MDDIALMFWFFSKFALLKKLLGRYQKMKQLTTFFLLFIVWSAKGQFNPTEAFAPLTYSQSNYRSASGKPSKFYWQNEADYHIKARFDTVTNVLSGEVTIDYSNNSPDRLDELWLQLDQNTVNNRSKAMMINSPGIPDNGKGYRILSVKQLVGTDWKEVKYAVYGTRMQIFEDGQPVNPGEKIRLAISYDYELLESGGGGRSGYMTTKNGKIYEFSYWYPRMCVYDDLRGWNTLPFIGDGEMYLDYGNVDYELSVPAQMLVVGAGHLENGKDVLSPKYLQRLDQASKSDKRVFIRQASDMNSSATREARGEVTWKFSMQKTRDVAWAMSKAYIWDAARINLPNGKSALAQSVYPIESTEDGNSWSRSTEFLKFSIEEFSKRWYVFPYPVASSVAGPVGGMEFPGLAFNDSEAKPYGMFLLASHEIGHTWFPMIVGSDERRNAWMDEGFNTFIDLFAHDDFNQGEFAPKRDGEFSPGKNSIPGDEIAKVIASIQNGPTMMTLPDAQKGGTVHAINYFKAAFGLVLLRDVILGKDRFDYAFKAYIRNWAYKHPSPDDFFRSMSDGSGEDLDWFWRGWFFNNWQFDVAVKEVTADGKITIENKQRLPLPIPVELKESDGETIRFTLPVEIWHYGATYSFQYPKKIALQSVVLDPEKQLPDLDRSNNNWSK